MSKIRVKKGGRKPPKGGMLFKHCHCTAESDGAIFVEGADWKQGVWWLKSQLLEDSQVRGLDDRGDLVVRKWKALQDKEDNHG